jgi:peptidoglycan/LPS O-acetylase OafA/YrhL
MGREDAGHLEQLDGLRGLAVLAVVASHFTTAPGACYGGWLGVCLFFVLSGFLITRILLTQRARVEAGANRRRALGVFYGRRALRIFPIYYLTLAVMLAAGVPSAWRVRWWLGTYTYNFYVAAVEWHNAFGHFWSLCVEEQFYLVWPFLILFCPRRGLLPALTGVCLLGPVWRLACLAYGTTGIPLYVLPFTCLDCLGMGSLLAYLAREDAGHPAAKRLFLRLCRVGGYVLMLLWVLVSMARTPLLCGKIALEDLFGNTALALFGCHVVSRATVPLAGDWGSLLRMRWLRFVGRVSYGIYVYHNFTPLLSAWLLPGVPWIAIPPVYANFALALALATVSWYLIERPLLGLKSSFRYEVAAGPVRLPQAVRRAA